MSISKAINDLINFKRVAVIISNKDMICLTKSNHNTYEFPGGKVENNESNEQAACRESLEEVAIKIKNVRYSGISSSFSKKTTSWNKVGTCYYYYADFDKIDKSLFNSDNDGRNFEWVEYNDALNLSKTSKFGKQNYIALLKLK
jgi:8-oxo-dGTP pyrophosphatase MutT (NUDIX family)